MTRTRHIRTLATAALCCAVLAGVPARAIVGGAQPADEAIARHVVLLIGNLSSGRDLCTGTAIARDLVLTAAHCVSPGRSLSVILRGGGRDNRRIRAARFERHPDFKTEGGLVADLALVKLAEPLPPRIEPAELGTRTAVLIGERFTVAGYGISNIDRDFGVLRAAVLMAIRNPSENYFLLTDPATRGEIGGLGVCSGDSGGPVFDHASGHPIVVAVISAATTAQGEAGCGGLTAATPLGPYRDWIAETAKKMGVMLSR